MRANYEENKAKIKVRNQARRNDAEQYERMKQRRKRYLEIKSEDYECECGAHIKRVSLHTHLLSKKHLSAMSQ